MAEKNKPSAAAMEAAKKIVDTPDMDHQHWKVREMVVVSAARIIDNALAAERQKCEALREAAEEAKSFLGGLVNEGYTEYVMLDEALANLDRKDNDNA